MLHHAYPVNDQREHVTDEPLCPCMPRIVDGVALHNSYDGRELGQVLSNALDMLGVALANHGHKWTIEEVDAYEHARLLLMMHCNVEAGD